MKLNGRPISAKPEMQPSRMWSSGLMTLDVDGHKPITGIVELVRIFGLVQVFARFDTDDEAFLTSDLFPSCLSTIERFPAVSTALDPLPEAGQQMTHYVIGQLQSSLVAWEAERKAVAGAMRELAEGKADATALQEKPPEVS